MYAYIDESGNSGFTKKSSKYFILTAILVEDDRVLSRVARKVYQKSQMAKLGKDQLHATDDSDKVKKFLIDHLSKVKYNVVYITVKKNKILTDCYLDSLIVLFKKLKNNGVDFIYLASKDNRKHVRDSIREICISLKMQITVTRPQNEKGLQVADFISWSLYQKYENNNNEFYEILKLKDIILE